MELATSVLRCCFDPCGKILIPVSRFPAVHWEKLGELAPISAPQLILDSVERHPFDVGIGPPSAIEVIVKGEPPAIIVNCEAKVIERIRSGTRFGLQAGASRQESRTCATRVKQSTGQQGTGSLHAHVMDLNPEDSIATFETLKQFVAHPRASPGLLTN